jgi:Acyclic terpene utilisation family protein AtuA
MNSVRIGNGCGFWGDSLDAPIMLARDGRLDYLTLDYLAELTMSILALQKQRDPQAGYATDFLDVLERLTPILKDQPGLKIVTNAGGMNPLACAQKARTILDTAGLRGHRIATVTGDNLLPHLDAILAAGNSLANLDTEEALATVRSRVVSANAYLGSAPIADALVRGASIVIAGRVADASLTVGPAVAAFGWDWSNWDCLAAATVAGHIIECGAQATGGLWCNWREAPDLANVGYPIAEINNDGITTISKPPHSGGAVNIETVAEQVLYEVGDPAAYLTPDVAADFTSIQLSQSGPDVVRIHGARGKPATDSYKVSIAYRDGFAASGTLVLLGPDAVAKARLCGQIILDRLRRAGYVPERSNIEVLGAGDVVPGVLPMRDDAPEVVLRVSVSDNRRAAVERFSKEFAPLVTSGTPGVTGYTTGRPPVREVFAYWPALVPKHLVKAEVRIES